MLIKTATKQDIGHLLILLVIALGIGIYLIATAVVIAKDGVTFIEYAQNLEVDAAKTMIEQGQHPGYPTIILYAHKIARFFFNGDSLFIWIYSAQYTTLMFRLFSIVVLYFIGKSMVGAKFSFWAVLILILLPKPAEYGSDALSDWPAMFFLASGMLLSIRAAISKKWWLFGFVGLAGGVGYLVRPECAQVVIYGFLWLILQLFWSKRIMSKDKTALALILLIIGFCVLAGPYMKLKGAVFPKKNLAQFQPQVVSETTYIVDIVPVDVAEAFGEMFENIGETLMWFFMPALFIGLYGSLKEPKWYEPERFFMIVLVGLNIDLMVLLYCKYGYMSGRHTLPLVVFTLFYIPAGLQVLAELLDKKLLKKGNANLGFIILMAMGIIICSPKLLRPLHHDKIILRKTAQWLTKNTRINDVLAVPDSRIIFYANRKGVDYKHYALTQDVQYIVQISKKNEEPPTKKLPKAAKVLYSDDSDGKYRVQIYNPVN